MKNLISKYIFSLAVSGTFAFALCIYVPLCTNWHGVNEFPFDGQALLRAMRIPFFLVWMVVFVLLLLSSRVTQKKNVPFLGFVLPVRVADIFALALVAALWLEGALLSKGLPSITGQTGLLTSIPRLAIDTAAWLAVLLGALFFWKRIATVAAFSFAALLVLLSAGLGDAYLNREAKVPIHAVYQQVMQNIRFHSEDNIITIVADAFPIYMAERALQKRPDLAAELEGFIFLRNNLATGGQTTWALPAMLQGAIYEGGEYLAFAEQAFHSPKSIPQFFASSGRNTYISSLLPRFCALWDDQENATDTLKAQIDARAYITLAFRFLPYAAKQYAEPIIIRQLVNVSAQDGVAMEKTSNSWFTNYITPRLDHVSAVPTGHFHHYFGVHAPYLYDESGKALSGAERSSTSGLQAFSEWELGCFVNFLKELKKRNMYDGATIVLSADHGDSATKMVGNVTAFETAVLMIKPRKNYGPLVYRDAPTSNAQLPELISKAHEGAIAFKKFLETLPEERKIFRQPDHIYTITGKDLATLVLKRIDIDPEQKPTKLKPRTQYTLSRSVVDFPLAVPAKLLGSFAPSGGEGLDFYSGKGEMILDMDCPPGKIDMAIQGYFFQYRDQNTAAHISLTITDEVSGSTLLQYDEALSVEEVFRKLDMNLKKVTVGSDRKIRLAFTSDAPKNCIFVLQGIMFGELKK